jgi:hypothetical protein
MRVHQRHWTAAAGWTPGVPTHTLEDTSSTTLLLVFGHTAAMQDAKAFSQLRAWYPHALIAGCSTAGEILDTRIHDGTLVATIVTFERTRVDGVCLEVTEGAGSRETAERLARRLIRPNLRHVLLLCDGLNINGSTFVRALRDLLPAGVGATGGLAGDADRFQTTTVSFNGPGVTRQVVGIGFYGDALHVGYGSLGGWDSFGPLRLITRATDNVLYELDGQPALDLYRSYLGSDAAGLPATGLLFPLALQHAREGPVVVRTVLAIDEARKSLTFAGDMPEGTHARLMKANLNRLVDGASGAAATSTIGLGPHPAELALLISCVGRKLVLRQRIEEETEAVRLVLGPQAAMAGFYSYGEICPQEAVGSCELHNQTMTVTTFAES